MKTRNVFKALFAALAAVVLIGCASTGPKAAVKSVGNLHFENFLESRCMLAAKPGILIREIDGSRPKGDQRYISPGFHTLQVQYARGSTASYRVTLSFTFEAGKAYIVDSEIEWADSRRAADRKQGNIRFFIEETNDPEAVRQYLAFSEVNPAYLQGTWTSSKKFAQANAEITFGGNKRFTIKAGQPDKAVILEGSYFFNENTIILYYEKQQEKDFFQKSILFYKWQPEIPSAT